MARMIVPKPHARPEVEVLVDGVWRYGLLRMWRQDDAAGEWAAQVGWSSPEGNKIGTFPAPAVRPLIGSPPPLD